MPRVTLYQGGQVKREGTTDARFRAADYGPGLGAAIEAAGREVAKFAERRDEIQSIYDEHDARALDLEHVEQARIIQSEVRQVRGVGAQSAAEAAAKRLEEYNRELLGRARSPRARIALQQSIARRTQAEIGQFESYADSEFVEGFRATSQARITALSQRAVDDPEAMQEVSAEVARLAEFEGWEGGADGEVAQVARQKVFDQVHGARLDRMFAAPDPNVDEIGAYLANNAGEMTPALRNQTLERLQEPLQGRIARSDADLVLGYASPGTDEAPAAAPSLALPTGPQGDVGGELTKAGFSGAVVAGFLGNFDVEGGYNGARGDGGTASGIAQWRHERRANFRKKFGKEPHEASHAEQAQFVVWEMQNPQAAGMTVAQRDAILNAKTPAEAAELIDQHYERSSGQHRAQRRAAAEKYGGAYTPEAREWDRTQVYANLEAVAEREGWNPERIERTRAELDKRIQKDEALLAEQRNDADEQATAIVQAEGAGFTSTNMIPREIWNKMSPSDKIAWEKVAEANRKPVEPIANGPRVMELNLMRYYEPEKFKALNLAKMAGEMTRAELDTLLTTQAQMRTKPRESEKWNPRSGIVTALNYGKKINQLDLESEDEAAILQIMEAEAWRMHQASGGKPLTENDYQTLFRSATRSVQTKTRFLGINTGTNERPRYELSLDMMPPSTRERLTRRLKQSGLPATDENLLRLYRLEQ